ncbi:hypothetical protein MMC31_005062 [Peltigera leucophlebia]|nr:hypothetical protein [Peltigera leucophlebia]
MTPPSNEDLVYPNDTHVTKPQKWDEILGMMEQPRPVIPLASYDEQYQAFCRAVTESDLKSDVMKSIFPLIAGHSRYPSAGGHSFQNMNDLTNGNIVKVQPEIYDGVDSSTLDPELFTKLRPFIKLQVKRTPVVPNFFGVFQSPGSREIEEVARYSGAICNLSSGAHLGYVPIDPSRRRFLVGPWTIANQVVFFYIHGLDGRPFDEDTQIE